MDTLTAVRGLARRLIGEPGIAAFRARQVGLRRFAASARPAWTSAAVARIREFGDDGAETFFGYYDVTPFSVDRRRLLSMRGRFASVPQTPGAEVSVGWYDLAEAAPVFRELGRTSLWCWQQGCRLRWHPQRADLFVYNALVDGSYGAIIRDGETGKIERSYEAPFYAMAGDGRWAFSLDFSRLQRLRPGYGYLVRPDATANDPAPRARGLERVDLTTGTVETILSIAEIAATAPTAEMAGAVHYLNHVEVNPNSMRIALFHVWLSGDGRRRTRLVTCDLDGGTVRVLSDGEMISHYTWLTTDRILAYAAHRGRRGFYIYHDGEAEAVRFGEGLLHGDGHPRRDPQGRHILLDTYPDGLRNQHLLLVDEAGRAVTKLGCFFSPWRFQGEMRCDLHPRWSPDGRMISIDSAHRGRRRHCVLELQEPVPAE